MPNAAWSAVGRLGTLGVETGMVELKSGTKQNPEVPTSRLGSGEDGYPIVNDTTPYQPRSPIPRGPPAVSERKAVTSHIAAAPQL